MEKIQMNGAAVSKKQEVVSDDFISMEILSRLPVKSLMRFKCVSKHWQSIIQNDKIFKDLHLSRSKKTTRRRTSFLLIGEPLSKKRRSKHISKERRENMYLLSVELLLPSDEENECVEVESICRWEPPIPKNRPISACKSLDGLICFMNTESLCVRVYNCSTRESTPWIKSIIKQQSSRMIFLRHELGYDPATKEHKVIILWNKYHGNKPSPPYWGAVCQVMTVGKNSWRRIDASMGGFSPDNIRSSVYVNGSIYFLCGHLNHLSNIVEFIVGREEFRLIKTTVAPADSWWHLRGKELMEVNGRLCVLKYYVCRKSITMQMLYYNDEKIEDKKSNMTTTSSTSNSTADGSNYHWVEENIFLPHDAYLNSIWCIPGTNLLIIRSLDESFSFFHNNGKKKSYSINKINNEISATLADEHGYELYRLELDSYTPNLLSVN